MVARSMAQSAPSDTQRLTNSFTGSSRRNTLRSLARVLRKVNAMDIWARLWNYGKKLQKCVFYFI
jgi:hypothetical protein